MKTSDILALEKLIDEEGLTEMVAQLASICAEKAEHITASYADIALAERWMTSAGILIYNLDLFPS